jgi:hypothetical protein
VNDDMQVLKTAVVGLENAVEALSIRVESLITQVEELLPAARRAAAMMDNSKVVKAREAVDRWRSGRG